MELYAVKPKWFEHLWGHGKLFEIWVVQVMVPGQKTIGDNLGKSFDCLYNDGMLSVLIRIAMMR